MATTAKIAKEEKKQAEIDRAESERRRSSPCRLRNRCLELRPAARISAQVLALPDLFPEVGARRRNPGRDQGELVSEGDAKVRTMRAEIYRPHCRHADTRAQRAHRAPSQGGRAGIAAEKRDGPHF